MARSLMKRRTCGLLILCLLTGLLIRLYSRRNIDNQQGFTTRKFTSQHVDLHKVLGKPQRNVNNAIKSVNNIVNETAVGGHNPMKDTALGLIGKESGNNRGRAVITVPSDVDKQLLVYNRVPKCGSRTVLWILRTNGKTYHFEYKHSMEFFKFRMKEADQAATVNAIYQLPRPAAFDMHVHWLNFTKFAKRKPIYINIIRDPLERHVSSYYFNRFGDSVNKFMVSKFKGTEEERHQSYDECVLLSKTECQLEKAYYIIPFFCGQDPRCREPTRWSLDQAVKNALNEYTFIGILEDLENSMKLLERMLPRYFNNAPTHLKYINEQGRRDGMHALKKSEAPPSAEVVQIMKTRLAIEYEFYDVIKERFTLLKKQYGIL
ncbi:uronyl 2-sulfotransferase-like [Glandiceps talaboti]